MRALLRNATRFLVVVAIAGSLAALLAAFLLVVVRTFYLRVNLLATFGKDPYAAVNLIELVDALLIVTGLLLFSIGRHALLIGRVELSGWPVIKDFHDLKVKLSSVLFLDRGRRFLKYAVKQ